MGEFLNDGFAAHTSRIGNLSPQAICRFQRGLKREASSRSRSLRPDMAASNSLSNGGRTFRFISLAICPCVQATQPFWEFTAQMKRSPTTPLLRGVLHQAQIRTPWLPIILQTTWVSHTAPQTHLVIIMPAVLSAGPPRRRSFKSVSSAGATWITLYETVCRRIVTSFSHFICDTLTIGPPIPQHTVSYRRRYGNNSGERCQRRSIQLLRVPQQGVHGSACWSHGWTKSSRRLDNYWNNAV